MSEHLREVTDLLHCKNIIRAIELPEMPVPELDSVTKMSMILPEIYTPDGDAPEGANDGRIEVVKIPFSSNGILDEISPTTLEVNIKSSDGRIVGFSPTDDPFFKSNDNPKFIREMIIPNSEQISLRAAVNENANHLMQDYFGLSPDEYYNNSGFDLFAELHNPDDIARMASQGEYIEDVESYHRLRFRLYIQTKMGYKAILEKIKDDNIQTDLLPENLIVLNNNEIIEAEANREANIKKLGIYGLPSGLILIRDALKRFG